MLTIIVYTDGDTYETTFPSGWLVEMINRLSFYAWTDGNTVTKITVRPASI